MAYAYVGSALNSSNSNAVSYSPTAGNLVVVFSETSAGGGTPTATITDNQSSPGWTTAIASVKASSSPVEWLTAFYLPNCGSGITTITLTYNGGTPGTTNLLVVEYSGIATSSPLTGTAYQAQSAPGTTTDAISSTAGAISKAPAAIVGCSFNIEEDTYFVAGTGFTGRNTASYIVVEDQRQTSTGSYAATWTDSTKGGSDNYLTVMLAFAEPSGGGGGGNYAYIQGSGNTTGSSVGSLAVTGFSPSAGNSIIGIMSSTGYTTSKNGSGDALLPASNYFSDSQGNTYNYLGTGFWTTTSTITISSFGGGTSLGATSLTLSANFSGSTGSYYIVFSDGECRYTTMTNGNSAVSWTTALTTAGLGTTLVYDTNINIAVVYQALSVTGTNLTITAYLGTNTHSMALWVGEYSGISAGGSTVGSNYNWNLQQGASTSTNGLTSGNVNVQSSPGMLWGFAGDEQSGSQTVSAGSTFTSRATLSGYTGLGYAVIQDEAIASNGNVASTATTSNAYDSYLSLGFFFPLSGQIQSTLLGQICL
jgi:hypothetical protein